MSELRLCDLPIEILTYIAVADYGYCYREMLAIPAFGRYALKNCNWLYERMTKIIQFNAIVNNAVVIMYRVLGSLHREDGPAIEIATGIRVWCQYGQRHRYPSGKSDCEIGPSVEMDNGRKYWYKNGLLHRDESQPCLDYPSGIGPAVITKDSKSWYKNGILHREDGPAVEYTNGKKEWKYNGILHRLDGPAIIHENGSEDWYYYGARITREEHIRIRSM